MTPTLPRRPGLLSAPLPDISAWVEHLRNVEIPILGATAAGLEVLRQQEDSVDANAIGELIATDPLMTLKVLSFASSHRGSRVVTQAETVTAALVMMGISPFFRAFGAQLTAEDHLAANPEALAGLHACVERTHRGANFALAFAVHRMDPDAAVVHAVALLHEFAELLLWCYAPRLQLQIRQRQLSDSTLRSSTVQREVLNVEVAELQRALMQTLQLPELLNLVGDRAHVQNASVRSVELGASLARHTQQSWNNAAIPDDVAEVAALLHLSTAATLRFLHEI
jgi:HD-like signal output (HDOD) protein